MARFSCRLTGHELGPVPDGVAQFPEPLEGGVFDDGFVKIHFLGGLVFFGFGFGSFFNSVTAFSKSKSTRRGCESTNTR